MYLFTRQGRLATNQSVGWATTIRDRASEVLGSEVQLWATTLSPGFGTITWTSWWEDLATLGAQFEKLQRDQKYLELANEGREHLESRVDDGLYHALYTSEGEFSAINVVSNVRAVTAVGQAVRAITEGVAIAKKFESITGCGTAFVTNVTGNYGGVGWLSFYRDLAAFEAANDKVAGDQGWITYVDSLRCYAEDVAASQATLHARIP